MSNMTKFLRNDHFVEEHLKFIFELLPIVPVMAVNRKYWNSDTFHNYIKELSEKDKQYTLGEIYNKIYV